jgi:hypothetical protein
MHEVNQPEGMSEFFEQLRPPVTKSAGFTETERYLAHLGERTFLNLWSYPSPYREQKLQGAGDGKELCDLLVICDPHIIIFSEKQIKWTDASVGVAWTRWLKRAVFDAAKQLRGAERWINEFPERIFLDKECTQPFPLDLPSPHHRRIHRVIVAGGAASACRTYFDGGSGTLTIRPGLQGRQHLAADHPSFAPFAVGDIEPHEDFVHVFDEVALDIVLHELDTITDFGEYLDKRAAFIRSGRLELASGEEDLLAYYATRINDEGQHDFSAPGGKSWETVGSIGINGGYSSMVRDPKYLAKKEADQISYVWDNLIEAFTTHLLDGTSIVLPGFEFSLKGSEQAVRYMALENRFMRRGLGRAVMGALEIGRTKDIFFRLVAGRAGSTETGFFIVTLKFMDWMKSRGGYDAYRQVRTGYLEAYAKAILIDRPHLRRVVGVAMEPPGQEGGVSEDNLLMLQREWTIVEKREHEEICRNLKIWTNVKERPYRDNEYPDLPGYRKGRPEEGNRRSRRAAAAKARSRLKRE